MRLLIFIIFCAGLVSAQKQTSTYTIDCQNKKISYLVPKNREMEDLFQALDFKGNTRCRDTFAIMEFDGFPSLKRFVLSQAEGGKAVRMEEGVIFSIQYSESKLLQEGIVFLYLAQGKAVISVSLDEKVVFDFVDVTGSTFKAPKGPYKLLVHKMDHGSNELAHVNMPPPKR